MHDAARSERCAGSGGILNQGDIIVQAVVAQDGGLVVFAIRLDSQVEEGFTVAVGDVHAIPDNQLAVLDGDVSASLVVGNSLAVGSVHGDGGASHGIDALTEEGHGGSVAERSGSGLLSHDVSPEASAMSGLTSAVGLTNLASDAVNGIGAVVQPVGSDGVQVEVGVIASGDVVAQVHNEAGGTDSAVGGSGANPDDAVIGLDLAVGHVALTAVVAQGVGYVAGDLVPGTLDIDINTDDVDVNGTKVVRDATGALPAGTQLRTNVSLKLDNNIYSITEQTVNEGTWNQITRNVAAVLVEALLNVGLGTGVIAADDLLQAGGGDLTILRPALLGCRRHRLRGRDLRRRNHQRRVPGLLQSQPQHRSDSAPRHPQRQGQSR